MCMQITRNSYDHLYSDAVSNQFELFSAMLISNFFSDAISCILEPFSGKSEPEIIGNLKIALSILGKIDTRETQVIISLLDRIFELLPHLDSFFFLRPKAAKYEHTLHEVTIFKAQ